MPLLVFPLYRLAASIQRYVLFAIMLSGKKEKHENTTHPEGAVTSLSTLDAMTPLVLYIIKSVFPDV